MRRPVSTGPPKNTPTSSKAGCWSRAETSARSRSWLSPSGRGRLTTIPKEPFSSCSQRSTTVWRKFGSRMRGVATRIDPTEAFLLTASLSSSDETDPTESRYPARDSSSVLVFVFLAMTNHIWEIPGRTPVIAKHADPVSDLGIEPRHRGRRWAERPEPLRCHRRRATSACFRRVILQDRSTGLRRIRELGPSPENPPR